MKLFWELYEEFYSTEYLLKYFKNLIEVYCDDKSGNLLDIGCGQSPYILDFINSGFKLYAVDEELVQIAQLKRRAKELNSRNSIKFINDRYPFDILDGKVFKVVILSEILHFMKIEESKALIDKIKHQLIPNSLVLIKVHSWNHPAKNLKSSYKHFFTKKDLNYLFSTKEFDCVYSVRTFKQPTAKFKCLLKKWVNKVCLMNKISNEAKIETITNNYLNKSNSDSITCLYRKK